MKQPHTVKLLFQETEGICVKTENAFLKWMYVNEFTSVSTFQLQDFNTDINFKHCSI